jgi:hypothetical protein
VSLHKPETLVKNSTRKFEKPAKFPEKVKEEEDAGWRNLVERALARGFRVPQLYESLELD